MQQWMPAVLSLFGTLIVVVITARLNTKALSAQIDTVRSEIQVLRTEVKLALSEFRLCTRI
jgi:hypothetical protein